MSLASLLFVIGHIFAQALPAYSSSGASVVTGETVYNQHCSSCHGATAQGSATLTLDFTDAAWSQGYAPAQVVVTALGTRADHPAALTDTASAWNATAYLWTLPMTAAAVQEGQAEANQAAALLKKGGLALLITKGNEIAELQDANWVMQHTESDLVNLITDVAADEYNALNAEHQRALIDYIYASHFQLPAGW